MDKTSIPWCDYTFNPITGCTNGCDYCYARKLAARFPAAFPNGFEPTFHPERLDEPGKLKKPSVIFVGSMGDVFDPAFTEEQIAQIFEVVLNTTRHTFMFLTKQYGRLADAIDWWVNHRKGDAIGDRVGNVLFGATCESGRDFENAMNDFPYFHFISLEPLLENPYLSEHAWFPPDGTDISMTRFLKFVIVGSKTPGRPLHETHPDWLDGVIEDCERAGVPLHYKHGGRNPEYKGRVYDWRPRA